jgi:hypothetical protein
MKINKYSVVEFEVKGVSDDRGEGSGEGGREGMREGEW